MNDQTHEPSDICWTETASKMLVDPVLLALCPSCGTRALSACWHMVDIRSRVVEVAMTCSACKSCRTVTTVLPANALAFFPVDRAEAFAKAMDDQARSIQIAIEKHRSTMPAAAFSTNALWSKANWSATTFRWHPAGEAPPVMGLVFDDAEAGKQIFRDAEKQMNHSDRFEEVRISIIEGAVPGQENRPGYTIHISPDPEALAAHATVEDFVLDPAIVPFLGQWNRHYPIPGVPPMLPRFKREFEKHNEFLLAPAVRRADGQLWFEPELGIIKNTIVFRDLSEITPDDPDAGAMILPQLITLPT